MSSTFLLSPEIPWALCLVLARFAEEAGRVEQEVVNWNLGTAQISLDRVNGAI